MLVRAAVKRSPPPSHLHRRYLVCYPGISPPPRFLSTCFNVSNTVLQRQHISQCEPLLKHNPPAVSSTNVVCLLPSLLLFIPVLFCLTPNCTRCVAAATISWPSSHQQSSLQHGTSVSVTLDPPLCTARAPAPAAPMGSSKFSYCYHTEGP